MLESAEVVGQRCSTEAAMEALVLSPSDGAFFNLIISCWFVTFFRLFYTRIFQVILRILFHY